MSVRTVLCAAGIAFVMCVAVTGCNELTIHDPPHRDAVESWATPVRPPESSAKSGNEEQQEQTKKKGSSFFFNEKSQEIEKSLGL